MGRAEQAAGLRAAASARRRTHRRDESRDEEDDGTAEEGEEDDGRADDAVVGPVVRQVGAHALMQVFGPQEALEKLCATGGGRSS